MNCKKMESIILTDYIDGNLKGRALEEVELHIRSCPGCHALVQELRGAGKLFRAVSREAAPAKVWHSILAEISAAPARWGFLENAFEYARFYMSHLKPAVVMASAAVLILFALTAIRLMPHKDYLDTAVTRDDILTISSYSEEEDVPEYDLGTATEMFFL